MSGPGSSEQVVFGSSDLAPVADLVRRFTTPGNDIIRWVDVRPLELPEDLITESKGLFGRKKQATPPGFQIIYVDASAGDPEHTLNLDARGLSPLDVATAAGVAVPAGWKVEGDKHAILGFVPSTVSAEELLSFAMGALRAVLGGWGGQFTAFGIGARDSSGPH